MTFLSGTKCDALRADNAKNVGVAFEDLIISRRGKSAIIYADNGTQFVNKIMAEIIQFYGIHHSRSPGYNLQFNLTERMNRF